MGAATVVLSLRELEAEITELAGHLNAAQHRWLTLIAEFDRRHGWNDGATKSCAHWLNYKCGIDLGAAREKVRVAHALQGLPAIAAAMSRGELSYSKVRALTRVATEPTESYFLDIALHGTAAHVEKLVRCYRRVQEVEELSREARQQANRSFTYYYDDDGSLVLKGRVPAEAGALLLRALESAAPRPRSPREVVSAETFPQRRADALAVIAESFLKHGMEALNGGERHQIVIHVDEETLRERTAGRCELEEGPSLAAETARRLACDASVVRIVEGRHGEPLDVGRKTRSIPPALRRALNARDRGCRFPGCSNQRYVDAHHIHHWADGGETTARNLVTLCRFHHRQVHEGRVVVQALDDGALRFLRPDGGVFENPAPGTQSDWRQLGTANLEHGVPIGPTTALSLWRGEQMDYGLAVETLLRRAQRARSVSAETPKDG
jgi:hypothetical protein